MIEFRDVSFDYGSGPVLDRVTFAVEESELLLVAGPTGSGKSTLLGAMTGLVPRFTGGRLVGEVILDGRSVAAAPPRERAHLVGHVRQHPAAGFVTDTVEEELAYGMEQLGFDPATMRRRVEEALDLLGIAGLRSRDLRTLSGGEQQRVAIGAVLAVHPRLLVLDEPTSALDPTAAEEVLATLARLVHDTGLAVVVAEHRLERVLPFADRMALLGDGGVRVGMLADLLPSMPLVPPIVELGRSWGWSPLPLTVRDARRLVDRSQLGAGPERVGLSGADDRAPSGSRGIARGLAAEVRGVVVTHGEATALRGVDLELESGTVTALMGRNGSGKSSLLWTLQGSRHRRAGAIRIRSRDPATMTAAVRREHVGLVPQQADDLLYLETVSEECAAADEGVVSGTCRGLLDRFVADVEDQAHPRDLSEGQRLALVLAIVLTAAPGVVLMDEPTRGLDYAGKRRLAGVLRGLAAEGRAVLVATHDVEFAAIAADRAVVMAEGEVVSAGPAARVLSESPAFAPQVAKILGPPWLSIDDLSLPGAMR
jgi:energy-coupling factor transport system ATP-binding protein